MSSANLAVFQPDGTPYDLSLLEQGRRLIEQARSIDEVTDIRDQAEAIRSYMKKRGESILAINAAAEIKIRAERRTGKILEELGLPKRGRPQKKEDTMSSFSEPSLDRLGVHPKIAYRCGVIADIPDDVLDTHISETNESGGELTTAAVLRLANRIKATDEKRIPEEAPSSHPRVVGNLRELIDRGQKFGCIYADPPWKYGNQSTRSATDDNYVTMSVQEICDEPVGEIAAENAHLHLWTTNAFLPEAFGVMEAWGFSYKSCFVWVKPQFGIGNYWRVSHEFLLFGVRGSCPFLARDEKSWAEIDRGRHSEKPDEIRQKVAKVSPGPYLEMYARILPFDTRWTVYGNQVFPEFPLLQQ